MNKTKRKIVSEHNTPLLKQLLAAGLDPNGFVFGDEQLLTKAFEKKYMDMAVLLNAGEDVNAVNGKDFLLKRAVKNNDAQAVELLLDAGAKVQLLYHNYLPMHKILKYYPQAAEVIDAHLTKKTMIYFAIVLLFALAAFGGFK